MARINTGIRHLTKMLQIGLYRETRQCTDNSLNCIYSLTVWFLIQLCAFVCVCACGKEKGCRFVVLLKKSSV